MQALVEVLEGLTFRDLNSIIIYCTRQQTTEVLAQMLRTYLQSWNQNPQPAEPNSVPSQPPQKGGKRRKVVPVAECYHAGMAATQRRSVQNKFMSGALRIVVATVAFGMGLNKADIRGVIHYNMPKSVESFVQEIGRAGRDGKPAHCHIFIDEEVGRNCEPGGSGGPFRGRKGGGGFGTLELPKCWPASTSDLCLCVCLSVCVRRAGTCVN